MALEFLGVDPTSEVGGSPTVWLDPDTGDYVLRGWIPDEETRAQIGEDPEGEFSIRFPRRMMRFFPEVNGGGGADV